MHISSVRMVKFKLLVQFPVTTQPCLVLNSLYANLMHSLIIWLIFRLYHLIIYICYFFSCLVYSCFDRISPYGVVFDYYQERFSSLLKFPFLSHVHVFLLEMSKQLFSHFCFLVIFVPLFFVFSVLFLVVVISFPPHFLSSLLVVISMLQHSPES